MSDQEPTADGGRTSPRDAHAPREGDPDALDRALDAFRAGRADALDELEREGRSRHDDDLFACLAGSAPAVAGATPPSIGGYRIVRMIGRGGMGVVYEAEQPALRRRVAIKVVRGGFGLDQAQARLFRREVQILARLRHPGIASIYDAGHTDDGRPFCVMELVEGRQLLEYVNGDGASARRRPLDLSARLRLFQKICNAVAAAHQKSVIHRDLKPANIMVVEEEAAGANGARGADGRGEGAPAGGSSDAANGAAVVSTGARPWPGGARGAAPTAQPKVLDFGLAKIIETDESIYSSENGLDGLIGTLPYMSPEQVAGSRDSVDTRSDVYALGVILYEILTGSVPYKRQGARALETMRAIREEAPQRPSDLNPALRGDLETIILKALEKDPARRYQGVNDLWADVERFLDGRPIAARRDSVWYVRGKLLRRHWRSVLAVTAGFLLCATAAIVMSELWLSSVRARQSVEKTNDALREILRAADPEILGKDVTVKSMLDQVIVKVDHGMFEDNAENEAFVRATAGSCYFSLGMTEVAEAQLSKARAMYEARHETASGNYADCLADLAVVQRFNGRPGAEDLLRQAIAMRETLFGPDDPRTIESVHDLGYFLRDRKAYPEAEAAFRRAIAARERNPGPTSVELAISCNSLGQLFKAMERWDEAEPMFLKARSIFALRPPTPNAAHNLNSLADLARKQGRPADAIALDTEALDIFRKSLLKDDTIFKRAAAGLARHLEEAGDYAAAAELWRELLAIWRDLPSRFPNDQPLVMAALGVDLERLGNFEEASTLCAAAYDDYASRGETQLAQTTVEKLVHLYEAWDAAAPGEGHADEAEQWRARLASTGPP